ncbi:MAG: glycoside hydrolase family 127 protein [Lentimicrobiaceae bacterium]|nr:glycoside hydrolase family 127 protein [Lentimicrobiaceae bacterium]
MKNIIHTVLILSLLISCQQNPEKTEAKKDYPIRAVPFTQVKMTDAFWKPRVDTNRLVSIPYAFQQSEITGRIGNFALAGGLIQGEHKGDFPFDDTDVYKIIEGASYSLAVEYDPGLDRYVDSLIYLIGHAQEDDGYLYTCRTNQCSRLDRWMGRERWERLNSHELYNCGHLYEAAVAHYMATGKRSLLDIALKNANLICTVFGPDSTQKHCPSGHPIVEMALVKLYRVTGEQKYLDLAKYFLDETGVGTDGHPLSQYSQDHKPIKQQDEAVGHAVRFGYLYSGVTDVAAITGDQEYMLAAERVWNNVVSKKLYVTGGIGARGMGEGFGENYELPNMTAYCETCASIANVYWNQRMFQMTGDSKYIDILEKTLYNALLSGVSISGDRFFYDNLLEDDGSCERQPWFGCACCPGNITRFMASVSGYQYAADDARVYVNLFAGSDATIPFHGKELKINQQTTYPWDGQVALTLDELASSTFDLCIRIPGWARNEAVPSDLYAFTDSNEISMDIRINGKLSDYRLDRGYAILHRHWKQGDQVEIALPMPVRRIKANDAVINDRNKVALQRGPIMYCLEVKDQTADDLFSVFLPDTGQIIATYRKDLLGGVMILEMTGKFLSPLNNHPMTTNDNLITTNNNLITTNIPLTAIPYPCWNNRGKSPMLVWIPVNAETAIQKPAPTIASKAMATASTDWAPGLNDQFEPVSSRDTDKYFFYWWLKKGTTEWVQYDFEKPSTVSKVQVYWLVFDHYDYVCRPPAEWRILYQKDSEWISVINRDPYSQEEDRYVTVSFDPVTTQALRLEAQLQKDFSAGILEWKIY